MINVGELVIGMHENGMQKQINGSNQQHAPGQL
jgi:hypothetical protein